MKEVKYIQKTGYNTFHKYKYATEADVNEKVREELAKQNVIMLPSMINHEMRLHTNRNGATEYITLVDMQFTFVDGDTGETFTVNMSGEGQDAGDKGIYKAIAGAQKYALMKVFMIPTGDDPEADEGVDERNSGKPKQPKAKQSPQQKQGNSAPQEPPVKWSAFWAAWKKLGLTDTDAHAIAGCESVSHFTRAQANELMEKGKILATERKSI